MLRVVIFEGGAATKMLRLSGSISGPWVAELQLCCETLLGAGHQVRLDLNDVLYVDRSGLDLLSQLKARGVGIACWTPLVKQLLAAHEAEPASNTTIRRSRIDVSDDRN